MGALPAVSGREPVWYDCFPARWQAVVWRNWGIVPVKRIASALPTDVVRLREAANRLGLDGAVDADPEWMQTRRGRAQA